MLLKVFELKPAFGMSRNPHSISAGSPGANYTFIVGTRNHKPTNRDRERIERAIAGAWEGIFDLPDIERTFNRAFIAPAYGIAVVQDSSLPTGETVLPRFVYNGFFIVFALPESQSAVSEEEEGEVSQELTKAIESQIQNMYQKPRIGVVTLYNCTVQVLEGDGYLR